MYLSALVYSHTYTHGKLSRFLFSPAFFMYNQDEIYQASRAIVLLPFIVQRCVCKCLSLFLYRFHDLFKAKLGFLGDDEGDAYLIAFLLKVKRNG